MLGSRVADSWKLPEAIKHVTRYHHDTVRGYTGPHAKILSCVELANVLCTLKGIGSTDLKLIELSPQVLKHLLLDQNDLRVLAEDMDHELNLHEELVKLVES